MKKTKDISWDIIALFAGLGFGYWYFLKIKRESATRPLGPAAAFGVRG
jgi:hypothetical protein